MKNHEFSNYALAITVVVCSAILFGALAFALGGKTFARPGPEVRINFADVTGIKVGSQVKYCGALAGTVTKIEMLSSDDRKKSSNPADSVQITVRLYKNVPAIPSDTTAGVEADTLLSDKFVQLSAGSADAPVLADNAVLQGIAPTTFDDILRELGPVMGAMDSLVTAVDDNTKGIIPNLQNFLNEAQSAVTEARTLVRDMNRLVTETEGPAKDTLKKVENAATRLQSLSQAAESMVKNNEKDVRTIVTNMNVTSQNLKVTSAYAKALTAVLAEKPSVLIWGGKMPALPSQQEILRSQKPIP